MQRGERPQCLGLHHDLATRHHSTVLMCALRLALMILQRRGGKVELLEKWQARVCSANRLVESVRIHPAEIDHRVPLGLSHYDLRRQRQGERSSPINQEPLLPRQREPQQAHQHHSLAPVRHPVKALSEAHSPLSLMRSRDGKHCHHIGRVSPRTGCISWSRTRRRSRTRCPQRQHSLDKSQICQLLVQTSSTPWSSCSACAPAVNANSSAGSSRPAPTTSGIVSSKPAWRGN